MSKRKWIIVIAIVAVGLGVGLGVGLTRGGGGTTPGEAPPAATIAYSPLSFGFSATEGGDNPSSQTLEIWNSGSGTLSRSVSDDADWLSLNPTSGGSTGEHDSVTVSVDITGMAAGSYNATITITAPDATNSPQTVSVSLDISSAAAAELPGTYSYMMEYSDTNGYAMSMLVQVKEGVGARTDWTTLTPSATTVIFISDGEFDWYYVPDYHMAFKYCPDSGMNPGAPYALWFTEYYYGSLSEGDILAAMEAACAFEPTCASVAITGHETILGEYCTIFTMTMTDGSTMSIWLPVGSGGWLMKWEYSDAMTGITSTMQFTAIDLSPTIPDSTFDVDQVFAPGTVIYDNTGPEC
jgi:outer membrane lipoprotein-sorting protein